MRDQDSPRRITSPAPPASTTAGAPTNPPTVRWAQETVPVVALDPRSLRRSVVACLLLITLWLAAMWVYQSISGFLFLLMLSLLFAIAMEPAIARLALWGIPRGMGTGLVVGTVIVVALGLGVVFGSLFFTQLTQLVQALPDVVTNAIGWINRTFTLKLDAQSIAAKLSLTTDQIGSLTSNLAGGVLGFVSSLLTALLDVFTFVVFACYFAADGPRIRQVIGSWLPPSRQHVFVTIWDIAVAKTGGYVVSKVELAALSAGFHAGFFYFIGVPYWLPLALFVGILAQFVPVIGTYIGIVVPVLFVVFTSPWTALWITAFASVYQQVENYVFSPRISKRTMDVNSGIALAAVFIGTALWGAMGALIGIPIVAAVVAVLDTYGHRYELVPALAMDPTASEDSSDGPAPTDSASGDSASGG